MKENLFSYGTLQKDKVQLELFGRLLNGTKDSLKGYKISTIEIKDETFLAKGEEKYQLTAIPSNNKDDVIEGTAFEVSKEELLVADKYEPDDYKRVKVELESGKMVWIYAAAQITKPLDL
ncbi:MAG: gamma-glutamylcyclotransferase family protein [Actinomycetota bacterium]